jgi:tetraacyldisaccharide 4'-kinase
MAYDRGWLAGESVPAPVLSIGNITAGGTGKTPLTSFLVEQLSAQGLRVGVVSRGYGGSEKGPARVPSDGLAKSAERYGDEPAWLAARHTLVPVVIGADRVSAASFLLREKSVDLLLADDAFQHRRLHRGFDAVVIDATEPEWHYRALPLGRLREGFSALKRAQTVFLTKTNLVSVAQLDWIRGRIHNLQSRSSFRSFEFESRIMGVTSLSSPATAKWTLGGAETRGRKVVLASGIGRPRTFQQLVERDLGIEVLDHLVFADHRRYTERDLEIIVRRAQACGAEGVVVTEKDAVKLAGLASGEIGASRPAIWVTRLETIPRTDLKEFYEAVHRSLFQRL